MLRQECRYETPRPTCIHSTGKVLAATSPASKESCKKRFFFQNIPVDTCPIETRIGWIVKRQLNLQDGGERAIFGLLTVRNTLPAACFALSSYNNTTLWRVLNRYFRSIFDYFNLFSPLLIDEKKDFECNMCSAVESRFAVQLKMYTQLMLFPPCDYRMDFCSHS